MMDIKGVLNVFDKKYSAIWSNKFAGGSIKNKNMSDRQLAEKLHKPITLKFKKRKIHSYFLDNIWSADLPISN